MPLWYNFFLNIVLKMVFWHIKFLYTNIRRQATKDIFFIIRMFTDCCHVWLMMTSSFLLDLIGFIYLVKVICLFLWHFLFFLEFRTSKGKNGTFIGSLQSGRLSVNIPLSGTREDIELKLKPYSQLYSLLKLWKNQTSKFIP